MPDLRTFSGVVDTLVPFAPTLPGRAEDLESIPIFIDAFTGEPVDFDPPNLKAQGRIPSSVLLGIGNMNHGKTATSQNIGRRLALRRIGNDRFMLSAQNLRGTSERTEWTRFCQIRGKKVYHMSTAEFNLIHPDLPFRFGELLQSVIRKINLSLAVKLTGVQTEALTYGLHWTIEHFPVKRNIGSLILVMHTITWADIESIFETTVEKIAESFVGDEQEDEEFKRLTKLDRHFSPGLLEAAREVGGILSQLQMGTFGEIFGGDNSPIEMLKDTVSVQDYAGLGPESIALLQSWFWEINTSAVVQGRKELCADMHVNDENHSFWQWLEYANPMARWIKTNRDTDTFITMWTHRFRDYLSVGSDSSPQFKLATNMLNDVSMFLLGKHSINASRETKDRLGLSDNERKYLLNPPVGTWGLKIGVEPLRMVKLLQTPLEKWINESNTANARKAIIPDRLREKSLWKSVELTPEEMAEYFELDNR